MRLPEKMGRWLVVWGLLWLALAVQAGELVNGKGLLWQVTGPDDKVSYVFGTMHSDDPRIMKLAPPVRQAFARSDRLLMEMEPDEEATAVIQQAMVFPPSQKLSDYLDDDWYERTEKAMADYGIGAATLPRLKPWVVITSLSMPPGLEDYLDSRLYRMARQQGKAVAELESPREQLAVLDGMPMADQIALLKEAVRSYPSLKEDLETMTRLYLARDLAGLVAFDEKLSADVDPSVRQRLDERLVIERNARMVKRMQPYLRRGGTFVAIGALHLPGEHGVIALLARQGYAVTPVY